MGNILKPDAPLNTIDAGGPSQKNDRYYNKQQVNHTSSNSPNVRIRSRAFQNVGALTVNQSQEGLSKSRS